MRSSKCILKKDVKYSNNSTFVMWTKRCNFQIVWSCSSLNASYGGEKNLGKIREHIFFFDREVFKWMTWSRSYWGDYVIDDAKHNFNLSQLETRQCFVMIISWPIRHNHRLINITTSEETNCAWAEGDRERGRERRKGLSVRQAPPKNIVTRARNVYWWENLFLRPHFLCLTKWVFLFVHQKEKSPYIFHFFVSSLIT